MHTITTSFSVIGNLSKSLKYLNNFFLYLYNITVYTTHRIDIITCLKYFKANVDKQALVMFKQVLKISLFRLTANALLNYNSYPQVNW